MLLFEGVDRLQEQFREHGKNEGANQALCSQSLTSSLERTSTPAYAFDPSPSLASTDFSSDWQKVFRDNREQYDEIVRNHVRQQLDI